MNDLLSSAVLPVKAASSAVSPVKAYSTVKEIIRKKSEKKKRREDETKKDREDAPVVPSSRVALPKRWSRPFFSLS